MSEIFQNPKKSVFKKNMKEIFTKKSPPWKLHKHGREGVSHEQSGPLTQYPSRKMMDNIIWSEEGLVGAAESESVKGKGKCNGRVIVIMIIL